MSNERIFLGLGSNLGDREDYLAKARGGLLQTGKISLIAASSIYETAPVGNTEQPAFLNQVIEVRSSLAPEALLAEILAIEKSLGRERKERWGPRTIDIDMLCYGQRQIRAARLTVPHPEAHRRRFVLTPWAEIAPEFVVVSLGVTVAQLLADCLDDAPVRQLTIA